MSASTSEQAFPDCGLYRTGIDLPGHETDVPAGSLVFFHNHSESGPPIVLLPSENTHNRWTFGERGWLCEDTAFVGGLVPLVDEGLYVVHDGHLHVSAEEVLAEKTLVQLGYNRRGDTILFVARFDDNTIHFPERGYRFESVDIHAKLRPVNFAAPSAEPDRVLH